MPDAFIYHHVRIPPRGRGKVDGALHELTALNLASQALGAAARAATTSTRLWSLTWRSVSSIRLGEAAADPSSMPRWWPATPTACPVCRIPQLFLRVRARCG